MKKVASGGPASAWGKAAARLGPPDTTFFISLHDGLSRTEFSEEARDARFG
jgi:hypothetical protein